MITEAEFKKAIELKSRIEYIDYLLKNWIEADRIAKGFNICNIYTDDNRRHTFMFDDDSNNFHKNHGHIFDKINTFGQRLLEEEHNKLRDQYNAIVGK